jgi:chloramphenicol O-acetyltransferase type A
LGSDLGAAVNAENISVVDLETWARREHFDTFRDFHCPHFNMCAEVDLTAFRPLIKTRGFSFNTAIIYVLARAANDISEFRLRIRGDTVVEHETVHPSSTVMAEGDPFTFAFFEYSGDFASFAAHVAETTARVHEHPSLADPPGRDDLLFMTSIPWVSFTSFSHPIPTIPMDSIPRFAWGRHHDEGARLRMPLSVQGHHALMDGWHVGRYYERVQVYLDDPASYLG